MKIQIEIRIFAVDNHLKMKVLELKHIRKKKDLVSLYLSQYSEKDIRSYINEIIEKFRKKSRYKQLLSIQEIVTFIDFYGMPEGYEMGSFLRAEYLYRKEQFKV